MATINPDNFFTTDQAAQILGVSLVRVRQFCQAGRLDQVKVADRWLISKESVDEFSKIDRPRGRPKS